MVHIQRKSQELVKPIIMNWIPLTQMEQLDEFYQEQDKIHILFKHSTRCSVSSMAKRTIEYNWDALPEGTAIQFLDLIAYRDLSNAIASKWNIEHESPQILVIQGDTCLYHASHGEIDLEVVATYL